MISVLIANYNNGHFFKDCYDSLINQTLQEFEVVVLDDCSSDDSFEVIQNIIKKMIDLNYLKMTLIAK